MKHSQRPCRRDAGPALALAFALALGLGGCTGAPYVDSRREAGQREPVGASTPDTVVICHASRSSTPEERLKVAESECAKTGRGAVPAGEAGWSCTLFAPSRAFYRCVAKPQAP